MNRRPRHVPASMTRAGNVTAAMMKVDSAPLDKLTDAMVESIARTHRVESAELFARVAARRTRETAR